MNQKINRRQILGRAGCLLAPVLLAGTGCGGAGSTGSADNAIKVGDMIGQFNKSRPDAERQYKNKVVVIQGMVRDFINNGVILTPSGGSPTNVHCYFRIPPKNDVKGQIITIRGICNGLDNELNVELVECEMVSSSFYAV